jgi:hypothetical protein
METTVRVNETLSFYKYYFSAKDIFKYSSYVLNIESRKILIPPGEVYGDFEKMFLPFDDPTWIAIAVTVTVAILSILVVKLTPLKIQEVVFGRNNRSPLMNLISILINGGQDGTMAESAPRICLMMAVFWSLIFR